MTSDTCTLTTNVLTAKSVFAAPPSLLTTSRGKAGDVEETVDRACLCNNLVATAGYGQRRADGVVEPPIVTSGKVFEQIREFIKPGKEDYSARDVLDYLLQKVPEPSTAV